MITQSVFVLSLLSVGLTGELRGAIPPVADVAAMARYIVHNSDYCVLSHINRQGNATGYPHGRVFSISDGQEGKSTGTPYFYNSDLESVARDLKVDNRCALTMSLIQGDYCKKEKLDAENPRCAQVMMMGHFIYVKKGSDEWNTARNALFSRHPEMATWPDGHNFQIGKFAPSNIQVLDYFGGSKFPTVPEYFNVTLPPNEEQSRETSYNSIYRVNLV